MSDSKTLFGLGTSNRSEEEFLTILERFKIEIIADVRSAPASKLSHFKKNNLQKLLRNNGVGYVWMGDALGGYAADDYRAYTRTRRFKEAIMKLKAIASLKRVCVICCEKDYRKCHRRYIMEEFIAVNIDE